MASDQTRNSPLSPATLHILLALAGGNLHGYGIIQEVARNTDGRYRLGPGTLYDNLKKLMDTGLVAEDDRRFYTLTKEGRAALTVEVDRLQSVVTQARLRLQEARSGRA
jgi:DNA-binding PadR family transcriptional regulator